MVQTEQFENNGVICERLVIKTKDFKADPNIKVSDFNIKNLLAIGVTENELRKCECNLQKSFDQIEKEAATANKVIEQYQLIQELENERIQTQNENE